MVDLSETAVATVVQVVQANQSEMVAAVLVLADIPATVVLAVEEQHGDTAVQHQQTTDILVTAVAVAVALVSDSAAVAAVSDSTDKGQTAAVVVAT